MSKYHDLSKPDFDNWVKYFKPVFEAKKAKDKEKEEIVQVTKEATDKIIEMKNIEGKKIEQDLLARIEKIKNKTEEISKKSTGLIEEYVVKLEKRIKEILKTEEIDKSRLAQEVVIYADKCSIEEEITRLKSHIYQFKNLISNNENETIGKKLDFIIQEMNRETNTIGSKANNIKIDDEPIVLNSDDEFQIDEDEKSEKNNNVDNNIKTDEKNIMM